MSDTKKPQKYPYRSIVNSRKFKHIERDLLKVILDPDKEYTVEEVKKMLDKELKREVK